MVLVGATGAEVLTIVLTGPGRPDLGVVDALARWQLWARRRGGSIYLREASEELADLLLLVGLLGEVGREAEGREDGRRVEKGVDRGDPLP